MQMMIRMTMMLTTLKISVNVIMKMTIISTISVTGVMLCYALKLLCWGVVDGRRAVL
jgi:hypothetical protein